MQILIQDHQGSKSYLNTILILLVMLLFVVGCGGGSSSTDSKATAIVGERSAKIVTKEAKITGLYVAFFNRAADQEGLTYWTDKADEVAKQGGDVSSVFKTLSGGFATHPTFKSTYDHLSNKEFVEAIYRNALGRDGDAEGIAYWTDLIDRGMIRSDMVATFVELSMVTDLTKENYPNLSAEELAAGQLRQDLITNKATASLAFTHQLGALSNVKDNQDPEGDPAYLASIRIISEVTEDKTTVASALAFLDEIKESADPIAQINVGYTVYTNPTDSRLSKKTDANATSVTYCGTKDSNGYPLSLDHITVQDPTIPGEFVYVLDNNSMLEKILTPEGIVFEIEELSDTSLELKTVSASGELQLSSSISMKSMNTINQSMLPKTSKQLKLSASLNLASSQDGETHTFSVNLIRCGKPVEGAIITMEITPRIEGIVSYVGKDLGGGKYSITTPESVDAASAEDEFKKCEKIGDNIDEFLGGEWTFVEPILTSSSQSENPCATLEKDYNTAKKYLGFGDKYDKEFQAIKKVCTSALINNLVTIGKVPNLGTNFKEVCQKKVLMKHLNVLFKSYSYTLTIATPGYKPFYTASAEFTPEKPYNLSIVLPPEIGLKKIYTDPVSPRANLDYRAMASMVCPDPEDGTEVTISWHNPNTNDAGASETETIYDDKIVGIHVPADPNGSLDENASDIIVVEADSKRWENNSSKKLARTTQETKTWIKIVNKPNICPASIEGKIIGGDGTMLTLPLTGVDDAWYMDDYSCSYSQDTVPLPAQNGHQEGWKFSVGLFISYHPQGGHCAEANENDKYHVSGTDYLTVKSTLRDVEVSHFINSVYKFDSQDSVTILKRIIDNAVKVNMGAECTDFYKQTW